MAQDFLEVASVWKFAHEILSRQTSKKFASEPPQTSEKSLQIRFHAEACPGTVLLVPSVPRNNHRFNHNFGAPKALGCTQAIPDKASHPSFFSYSIHRICGTCGSTLGMLQNTGKTAKCTEKKGSAHADGQREKKAEEAENREGRLCQGWLWATWAL